MSQKLPADGFEWVKEISQFIEGFIESYNKEKDNLIGINQCVGKLMRVSFWLQFVWIY